MAQQFASVDDYIASFPDEIRSMLDDVRSAIHRAVPEVEESISYDMATFGLRGRYLVYCAGWKRHVSLHAVPELPAGLESAVTPYRSGRGTVTFPHRAPVPVDLVEQIVAEVARRRHE
jgi:uncharacterized protein YdhG (YjbR/CyaY superfamily)